MSAAFIFIKEKARGTTAGIFEYVSGNSRITRFGNRSFAMC